MNSILLVDDEKWVRLALKWTVEKSGLPVEVVHECANGLEALDWLREHPVDLVITDIRMPVMDGLALVREVRDKRLQQDIIIISVHDEFSYVQKALREGVCDYLLKPVEAEDMKVCLTNWLTRRSNAAKSVSSPDGPEEEGLSPVQKVLRYIKNTPPGQVTLTEAAKAVHMNACYLSQLFKQEMNINFVDYVTDVKMTEAKRLLSKTSLRISEIADRLGYADVAYFSNIFKKTTSMTPSEYRQKAGRS